MHASETSAGINQTDGKTNRVKGVAIRPLLLQKQGNTCDTWERKSKTLKNTYTG